MVGASAGVPWLWERSFPYPSDTPLPGRCQALHGLTAEGEKARGYTTSRNTTTSASSSARPSWNW
jgi:hypothetical protein